MVIDAIKEELQDPYFEQRDEYRPPT